MEDGHYVYFEKVEELINKLQEKGKSIEKWNETLPKSQ